MSETKTCSKCGEVKAVEFFRPIGGRCRACLKFAEGLYRKENSEKIVAARKTYNDQNKQKNAERKKKYCAENADKIRAYKNKFRIENHEKVQLQEQKYYKQNREKISTAGRRFYLQNREKILQEKKQASVQNKEKLLAYCKVFRDDLADTYIKNRIGNSVGCTCKDIPAEFIDAKRKHLQILRKIKEMKNG